MELCQGGDVHGQSRGISFYRQLALSVGPESVGLAHR